MLERLVRRISEWAKGLISVDRDWTAGAPWKATGLAVALLCVVVVRTSAAAFEVRDEGWQGSSDLWRLATEELSDSQVHVVSKLDYGVLQPEDALLILHPQVEIHFHSLAAFLSAGGRAAIIDDFGRGDALLKRFHLQRGQPSQRPRWTAQGNPNLAIATPSLGPQVSARNHPMLRDVEHVVTNHASTILPEVGIELTRLLSIQEQAGGELLLAATGVIGDTQRCEVERPPNEPWSPCGRLVAIGDPSIFINQMLRFSGNRQFASGLLRYLIKRGEPESMGGNLYLLVGEISQTGTYAGRSNYAEKLEDWKGRAVDKLRRLHRTGMSDAWAFAMALFGSAAVVLWGAQAVGQSRAIVVPSFAKPVPLEAQGGFAGRYANLASLSEDRAMLLLELQRTLEATLRLKLGLGEMVSRDEICQTARSLNALNGREVQRLEKLFQQLSTGETAVLSGQRLSVSDRSLDSITDEIVAIVARMDEF